MKKVGMYLCCLFFTIYSYSQSKQADAEVYVIGAMKEVKAGNLEATTEIKKSQGIDFMYGLGPLDSLTGEVTIIDGQIFVSTVKDGQPVVQQVEQMKAPFFVLAEVPHWNKSILKNEIQSLTGIEAYLLMAYHIYQKPFAFQIKGTFDSLTYHIQNRVGGSPVANPFDMHQDQASYTLHQVSGTLIGFYSPSHEGYFTHKGNKIHVHFLSDDKLHMGHLDKLWIGDHEISLFLPRTQ